MSVNLIVEKAGVAKGTFFHHFADRAALPELAAGRRRDPIRTALARFLPPGIRP